MKIAIGMKPPKGKVSLAKLAMEKYKSMPGKNGVGSGMMDNAVKGMKKHNAAIKKAAGKAR